MRPWLFRIGDFGVPSYWALLVCGFVVAIWFIWREARHDRLDADRLLDLNLILMLAGVVGARLMHVLAEDDPLRPGRPVLYYYLEHPAAIFELQNGLAFYGGLLVCIPLAVWFLRRKKMPLGEVADIYGVAIPLGLVFGRIGCFLAGCCHGKPTDLPIGVVFDDPLSLARPLGVPLHPTQLYASAFALVLFGLLWWTKRRHRAFPGQVFLYFMVLYAAGRFLIELVRNDNRGMHFGNFLSSSQVVAIPVLLAGIVLLWILRARQDGHDEQERPAPPVPADG